MNKKLGQNMLKNPGIVDKIIEASNIRKDDIVMEIGPVIQYSLYTLHNYIFIICIYNNYLLSIRELAI